MVRTLTISLLVTAALVIGCDDSAPELADTDATDVLDTADAVDERCKGVSLEFGGTRCPWQEQFTCDLGLQWCPYDYPIGRDGLAWAWCTCGEPSSTSSSRWGCQTTECKPPEHYDME